VIGLLIKIYHSVGIEEILEYQRNITNKNPYPSYELIYLLFELNFSKFDQVKIRKTYNKFSDENNFVAMRAMSLFVQEYMNNHKVDQGIRQSIYEMLNIHYVPNKALLLNAK
jgi:hypothetical protein